MKIDYIDIGKVSVVQKGECPFDNSIMGEERSKVLRYVYQHDGTWPDGYELWYTPSSGGWRKMYAWELLDRDQCEFYFGKGQFRE